MSNFWVFVAPPVGAVEAETGRCFITVHHFRLKTQHKKQSILTALIMYLGILSVCIDVVS